jgi:hypothetical protein
MIMLPWKRGKVRDRILHDLLDRRLRLTNEGPISARARVNAMCVVEFSLKMSSDFSPQVDRLIELALEEDIGRGDVTTQALISPEKKGAA